MIANAGRNEGNAPRRDDYRVVDHNVQRIPPRDRGFMRNDMVPGHYYGRDPHYFGYHIQALPPRYRKVRHYGIDYFIYNDIYYRLFNGHYVICRPPVGIVLAASIRPDYFAPVRFSFYCNVYRPYTGWDSYSRYIDEQNRTIAQNNAIIARQNAQIAMNLNASQSSYDLANRLGLTQSYAYASSQYYYDDGVFYIINSNGQYSVIVPPAGALVDELPDDYDTLTISGMELYRVDDTVYRTVMMNGHPYLEVLGQMYGDMARRYVVY